MYTPVEMLSAKGAITNRLQQLLKEYQSRDLLPCKSDIMPSMLDTSKLAEKIGSFGLVLGGSHPGEAKTDLHIPIEPSKVNRGGLPLQLVTCKASHFLMETRG